MSIVVASTHFLRAHRDRKTQNMLSQAYTCCVIAARTLNAGYCQWSSDTDNSSFL